MVRLPLTGCTADPGGRPGWAAAASAGLTWQNRSFGAMWLTPLSWYPVRARTSAPTTPYPSTEKKLCVQLIKDLTKCADQLGADLPPRHLHLHLPHSMWPESGSALHTTRQFAALVSDTHYVRIVDKGVGAMWAFCRHWVWSVLDEFLIAEGYVASSLSVQQALSYI